MFACERMLGLDDPIHDDLCCGWCGEPSTDDICATCQQRYEEAHDDTTVFPFVVKIEQVCGLYRGRIVLPSGAYLYTPARYRRYVDALHAAAALAG